MMRTEDITTGRVLNEYRQGDLDKRLCLFLYYRELREEFSRIKEDDADCFGRQWGWLRLIGSSL